MPRYQSEDVPWDLTRFRVHVGAIEQCIFSIDNLRIYILTAHEGETSLDVYYLNTSWDTAMSPFHFLVILAFEGQWTS